MDSSYSNSFIVNSSQHAVACNVSSAAFNKVLFIQLLLNFAVRRKKISHSSVDCFSHFFILISECRSAAIFVHTNV